MKILHVVKKYKYMIGGDAIAVAHLSEEQRKNGDEVYILTSKGNDVEKNKFVTTFGFSTTSSELDRISTKRLFSLVILLISSFKFIRKIKPDVVHIHSMDMGFVLYPSVLFYRVPFIYTAHCGLFINNKNFLIRRILENFIFSVVRFNKIVSVNKNDSIGSNIIYIPNGVDKNKFIYGNNTRKNICLFVGRIERDKGIFTLIKSIKLLKQDKYPIKLLIIGRGSIEEELKNSIIKSDLKDSIEIIPGIPNEKLVGYYTNAFVTVLPSNTIEAFGITLLESMSCGTPVVATEITGLAEEIKENNAGTVIKKDDPKALAAAIKAIYTNKTLASKMGLNGRKLIEKKYSWGKVANSLDQVYKNVL